MKLIHIVMIVNFVLLAIWGSWVYSVISTEQTIAQHVWECTTDTECEEEELDLLEGKQA